MNDKATLLKAVGGASAVYAVTNYWEKADHELEMKQGRSLVDVAKEAGVNHFIWSSLINVTKRKPRSALIQQVQVRVC
jgi:uncharacterized protein YbjT (DUF2867 family)